MKVAFPIWNNRISPVLDAARNPNSFHGSEIAGSVREEKGNGNTDEFEGKGKKRS